MNTSASKAIAAVLSLALIAAVIASFVAALNSLTPAPPPEPVAVTVWNCGAADAAKCVPTTAVGATGYSTESECLSACNARTGYNCEIGTDGWPTGKCIASQVSYTFSSLAECERSCASPDTEYTVQCVDSQGCVPTDGSFAGPTWKLRKGDLGPCTAVCRERYRCTENKTCSPPVRSADSQTYPVADSCDDVQSCGLAPATRYAWTGATCGPARHTDASAPRAESMQRDALESDCGSITYPTFDQCMQASCTVCTSSQFPHYCQGAKQCSRSQEACCGTTTCGRCSACKDGVCHDACSGDNAGCRTCETVCDKDGKNCKDTCVCNSLPPVQRQCDGLCICEVLDASGKPSQKFCDQIAEGDAVQSCRVQHLDPAVICGSPDKKVWCLTPDDSWTSYIPGSCKCYDLDALPPPCPKEYPNCSQIQCM